MGARALENWVSDRKLILTEHALKSKPGARHWHLRHSSLSGTVELTLDERNWSLVVRTNRRGIWITPSLLSEIEDLLSIQRELEG